MISFHDNSQNFIVILLSLILVIFTMHLHLIPSFILFILVFIACLLNFWINSARFFIFFCIISAIAMFLPNILIEILRYYVPSRYIYLVSISLLVSLISFIAGRCFCVKKTSFKGLFLLGLVIICAIAVILFRDKLIYEKLLLTLFLFLISYVFINVGASEYTYRKLGRFQCLLFSSILVSSFLIFNYFIVKSPARVGLIECFGDWAETKAPYSLSNVTLQSGYSYSLMRQVLESKYQVVSLKNKSSLGEMLKHADVAIIITPTTLLDNQDEKILEDFVVQGGRLVVLADHTDLYGHGRVLNKCLKSKSIGVEYNALFKPDDYYARVRLPNLLIQSIRPKTPCSLLVNWNGSVFAWADNWVSESADYTRPNFFGELTWTSDDSLGNWPVGAIIKKGKGMIVAWGDSTIFANFCIFQPGHLNLLRMLIEGGEMLAIFLPYCLLLLICTVFILCFEKLRKRQLIYYFALVLLLLSGTFYLWNFSPENLYRGDKRIDIYCDKALLDESPPEHMPKEGHLSAVYSHIARCGLWPFYRGYKPMKPVLTKSIWITSLAELDRVDHATLTSLWGVILNTAIPEENKIGFNIVYIDEKIAEPFRGFFNQPKQKRRQYVTNDSKHTLLYRGVPIFAAEGVITDIYLGDWWITTDISPYRYFMLRELFDWLIRRESISKFIYPKVGAGVGGRKWFIKFGNKVGARKNISIKPYDKEKKFVYLGSGIWSLYEANNDGEFLLGGPETSDNWFVTGDARWAAQTMKK